MSATDLESIEAQLREIRRLLEGDRSGVQQLAFSVPEAAVMLGCKLTKMRRLLRTGAVATVTVGDREMVPRSEIDRILTPTRKSTGKPSDVKRREKFATVPVSPRVHAAQLKAKQRPARAVAKTSVRADIDAMLKAKSKR